MEEDQEANQEIIEGDEQQPNQDQVEQPVEQGEKSVVVVNIEKENFQVEEDEETKKKRLELEELERKEREEREEADRKAKEEAEIKLKEEQQKFNEYLKTGVSQLSKVADGSTYAFVKMNLAEKEIDRIFDNLASFSHLRYLDVSSNKITDLSPVSCLQFYFKKYIFFLRFLVQINASKNEINSIGCFRNQESYKYLQYLNLQTNKITKLEPIHLPKLRRLNLNENEIISCEEFTGHNNIQVLELRKNKLKNTNGIGYMPELLELYLAENEITDFRSLTELPKLVKLHLRKNAILKIRTPVPELPSLYHLNLRENQIAKFDDLKKVQNIFDQQYQIAKIKTIQSVNMLANPITDEMGESFKTEVLMFYHHFLKINKQDVTQEEIAEATKQLEERIQEEERKRQEEEENKRLADEEARKLAEEEAQKQQPEEQQE